MTLICDLKSKYKTIAVVGMAKNAGKTTTLNYLIEQAVDNGIKLGITSTGRDGETIDVATGTDKPKVYLYPQTLVSVPASLFEYTTANMEILRMTKYHTSLGPAMICRVIDGGDVQIAGPVLTSDQLNISNDMLKFGAEMILIDGAIDRKSIASPEASDAIILATGAVLSRNMQKVVAETAYTVSLYSLKLIDDATIKERFHAAEKITVVGSGGNCNEKYQDVRELDIKTGFASSNIIDEAIDGWTKYVYIPGALTSSVIENISPKKFQHVTFVVKDATKIFLSSDVWHKLVKKGFVLRVLNKVNVAAISINATSPEGYSFERNEFMAAMKNAMPEHLIIDVKQ
jgi:hypothetical protein